MAVQVLSGHGPDPLPNRTEGATGRSHCLETGERRHSQSLQSISPHPLPWFQVESRVPGACASAFALPAWATVRVTPSPSGSWPQVIETKELVLVCSRQAIESKGVPYRDRRGGPQGDSFAGSEFIFLRLPCNRSPPSRRRDGDGNTTLFPCPHPFPAPFTVRAWVLSAEIPAEFQLQTGLDSRSLYRLANASASRFSSSVVAAWS